MTCSPNLVQAIALVDCRLYWESDLGDLSLLSIILSHWLVEVQHNVIVFVTLKWFSTHSVYRLIRRSFRSNLLNAKYSTRRLLRRPSLVKGRWLIRFSLKTKHVPPPQLARAELRHLEFRPLWLGSMRLVSLGHEITSDIHVYCILQSYFTGSLNIFLLIESIFHKCLPSNVECTGYFTYKIIFNSLKFYF